MTDQEVCAAIFVRLHQIGSLQPGPGSNLAKEANATAQEFGRIRAQAAALARDISPATTVLLLPEWEADAQSIPRGNEAVRRLGVVKRLRDRATPNLVEMKTALRDILGYEPAIWEVTAEELPPELASQVFLFAVEFTAGWPDERTLARVYQVLDTIKQAHTDYYACRGVGFRCDDDDSLTDRDLLDE
jgi:hypothetical protein